MISKLRKGDLVEVQFHDHCEDGSDAMDFTVWGRIRRTTRSSLIIESWAYTHAADDAKDAEESENRKVFVIVKKAIIGCSKLRRTRVK